MHRSDTSKEMQALYDEMLRGLTDEERFLRGLSLTQFSREMCWAGLRDRFPEADEAELRVKFFEYVYGDAFSDAEIRTISSRIRKAAHS